MGGLGVGEEWVSARNILESNEASPRSNNHRIASDPKHRAAATLVSDGLEVGDGGNLRRLNQNTVQLQHTLRASARRVQWSVSTADAKHRAGSHQALNKALP